MARFRLVPDSTNIDFLRWRRVAVIISGVLILGAILLFALRGLNFGIDFVGGTMIEVRTPQEANLAEMRETLGALGLGDISLQTFGSPRDVLIRIQAQEDQGAEGSEGQVIDQVRQALDPAIEFRRTEFVGPVVGDELIRAGAMAVGLAILAILAYIWFRFEWQFGIGAIAALVHDVIATIGLFALLQLEFNLSTIAAILTIAGYSINDTVVVYDRIRDNLRRYKKKSLMEVLNLSTNQVLARTVMTSVTTLLALGALFFLGGDVIRGFSIALIWGVVIGTYSSLFVAVPLLLRLNVYRGEDEAGSSVERTAPQES